MHGKRGFTLIELMITIAIVGILAALAGPGFFEFVRGQRAVSQVNDLVASLNLGRNEAISRGTRITVCGTSDPNVAAPTCDGSWSDGWIVFTDAAGATFGSYEPGAGETLLRAANGTPGSTLVAKGGRDWVGFNGQGLAARRQDFELQPDKAPSSQYRTIEMKASGRVQAGERFN